MKKHKEFNVNEDFRDDIETEQITPKPRKSPSHLENNIPKLEINKIKTADLSPSSQQQLHQVKPASQTSIQLQEQSKKSEERKLMKEPEQSKREQAKTDSRKQVISKPQIDETPKEQDEKPKEILQPSIQLKIPDFKPKVPKLKIPAVKVSEISQTGASL